MSSYETLFDIIKSYVGIWENTAALWYVDIWSEFPHYLFTHTQEAFTCSKLATETLEQGVKYVQS